jgi:hypothetical protein
LATSAQLISFPHFGPLLPATLIGYDRTTIIILLQENGDKPTSDSKL